MTSRPVNKGSAAKLSHTSGKNQAIGGAQMSRIGRMPIAVPQGVTLKIEGNLVSVKVPKASSAG